MSTDPAVKAACPIDEKVTSFAEGSPSQPDEKKRRSVRFPNENQLVTEYFEPANPWRDVPTTTRAQLAQDYLLSCRRHNTAPIDSVLQQIRELPEQSIGGGSRAARLGLAECSLAGAAPADALEAVLRNVQFRRIELDHAEIDDEGAEALFDMIEYYESACVISIAGPRQFGIRGWQAASRMIKKSAELSELELSESALEAAHAPVLARALRPHSCRLRALCLQRATLSGEALMCLVIALKSNGSIRELRLPDNYLTPHDAQQLGSLLRFNTNIQLLDLSNNQIQDIGVGHIADALVEQAAQSPPSNATSPLSPQQYPLSGADAKGLAFLVLWNNQLTRNCAQHLTRALRSSHSLCVLNVGRNALGTDSVRALQSGASHGALLSLGLQCARLGPEAGAPLAQLLLSHVKLQRLDLRDNRLGTTGLQALHNAMKENHTLTQIDLDDPAESTTLTADDSDAACVARLTRDIRALCRRNEPPATETERRVHRKISLTCHTACVLKSPSVGARCRLRSPAPSPAPSPASSPTPHHNVHHTRFSVTRVTPERESSTESSSPTTPTRPYCTAPSRFKVMQVTEPPSIQVHPVQKRPVSRFSVTRNYDTAYNPSPRESPSASPTPSISTPSPSVSPCPSDSSDTRTDTDSPRGIADKGYSDPRGIVEKGYSDLRGTAEKGYSDPRGTADKGYSDPRSIAAEKGHSDPRGTSEKGYSDPRGTDKKGYSDNPNLTGSFRKDKSTDSRDGTEKVTKEKNTDTPRDETKSLKESLGDSPRVETEKSYIDSPRERTYKDTPRVEKSKSDRIKNPEVAKINLDSEKRDIDSAKHENMLSKSTNLPNISTSTTDASSNIDKEKRDIDSENQLSKLTDLPTTSAFSSTDSKPYYYCSPSITTLSGALFSKSVPEMSTKYRRPCLKSNQNSQFYNNPQNSEASNATQYQNRQNLRVSSDSINIPQSSSESVYGRALYDSLLRPTAVPNSRFSISPSPISFIHGVESFYTKPDFTTIIREDSSTKIDSTSTKIDSSGPKLDSTSTKIDSSEAKLDSSRTKIDSSEVKLVSTCTKIDSACTKIDSACTKIDSLEANLGSSCTKLDSTDAKLDSSSIKLDSTDVTIDSFETKLDSSGAKSKIDSTSTKIYSSEAELDSSSTKTDNSETKIDNISTKIDTPSTKIDTPSTKTHISDVKMDNTTKIDVSDESGITKIDVTDAKVCSGSTEIVKSSTKIDSLSTKIDNSSIITDSSIKTSAITEKIDDSNRSQKETSICRDVSDENIPPVVTCDMKSSSTDVSSYTGGNVPSGIEIIQIGETDLTKQDLKMTETKMQDKVSDKCENIDDKTFILKENEEIKKDSEKLIKIETQRVPERLDRLVSKYIEKAQKQVVSKDKVIEKAVDFAAEPEEVIFFISDEPISFSDRKSDNICKTYSDVVKTDFKDQITYNLDVIKDTKLVKSVEISDSEKVAVKVTESVKDNTAKVHSDKDFVNIDDIIIKDDKTMKKIEAITEGLGNLIQDMKVMSTNRKCTVDVGSLNTNIVPANFNRDVVLKKNKSESSLDSPDLEVSRLMNKKLVGSPFRDSNSSLEISGSSMESLNAIENVPKPIIIQESVEKDTELDRRKDITLSTESSVESTSDVTPVNSQNFLTTSVSSNESVSPILFGKTKKIHGSLSSLEASMSSLDSKQDKIMVTSADSGIEHSLQNPSDSKDDASSNEGTLTHNSSLKETVKRTENLQETLTDSPKRTSSLLDVPALKSKGLDKMRKISWVAPSPSFHIPREPERVKEEKPSHLEKLLSLFQHPTSLFSRAMSDDEKKSASNTPPRKDSCSTSSFWPWGSPVESKEERDDSSEATDSTLSERVQVSFVDESFSKKLDSKTPSTDTDNTLSEFQSFSQNIEEKVTDNTTDVVQKCLDLSLTDGSETNQPRPSDTIDLSKPNDFNRNETQNDTPEIHENIVKLDEKDSLARPRSFAAVLKASGSENTLDKQPSPETGQLIDKLPVKVIRGIKENISPENTLTSSVTNTRALAEIKHPSCILLDKSEPKIDEVKADLAPIATIEETCDIVADNFSSETIQLAYIDDVKIDIAVRTTEVTDRIDAVTKELEVVDLGKDALSYLMYEALGHLEQDKEAKVEGSLAQELKEAAIKEMSDRSPELVIDEAILVYSEPKPGTSQKMKKSNSLEDLSQRQETEKSPKAKSIAFKMPETSPRDIPRRTKLRSRSGSSPKSLPESLNKPCPLTKMDLALSKKKKKVSSLGKMARDSLLALNMSEDEMAEFRRSYKLTSVESLRSLESVSEDAYSQSGASIDSRCRSCLRTSQESLMSLDSITDECKCQSHSTEKRIP